MADRGAAWTRSDTTRVKWINEAYLTPAGPRGIFFAEDDRFQGCWGEGDTEEAALNDLCAVIQSWWELKSRDGDDDLPAADITYTGVIA